MEARNNILSYDPIDTYEDNWNKIQHKWNMEYMSVFPIPPLCISDIKTNSREWSSLKIVYYSLMMSVDPSMPNRSYLCKDWSIPMWLDYEKWVKQKELEKERQNELWKWLLTGH